MQSASSSRPRRILPGYVTLPTATRMLPDRRESCCKPRARLCVTSAVSLSGAQHRRYMCVSHPKSVRILQRVSRRQTLAGAVNFVARGPLKSLWLRSSLQTVARGAMPSPRTGTRRKFAVLSGRVRLLLSTPAEHFAPTPSVAPSAAQCWLAGGYLSLCPAEHALPWNSDTSCTWPCAVADGIHAIPDMLTPQLSSWNHQATNQLPAPSHAADTSVPPVSRRTRSFLGTPWRKISRPSRLPYGGPATFDRPESSQTLHLGTFRLTSRASR